MAVVTVSRKIGSFGDEVAALAADKLGYRLIGRDEIQKLAQDCDAEFKKACGMFESELSGGFFERFFFKDPSATCLFKAMNLELAASGDVVLVGRGAQIVLANVPGVLKIRVVAPYERRVQRVQKRENIGPEQALELVRKHDRNRRALIESIFDANLADWSLYDLVINTSALPMDAAAEIVALGVKRLPGPDWSETAADFRDKAFACRVEAHIKRKVPTAPHRDIVVEAKGGNVTLNGLLRDKRSRETAVAAAKSYPGVESVEDNIKTTDLSF